MLLESLFFEIGAVIIVATFISYFAQTSAINLLRSLLFNFTSYLSLICFIVCSTRMADCSPLYFIASAF